MEFAQFVTDLRQIAKTNQEKNWESELDQRKLDELEFHDTQRNKKATQEMPQDTYEMLHANKKYYQTVGMSRQYLHDWIRNNSKDKVVLDFACGNGGQALMAAEAGAKLAIGIDLSGISIENANKAAQERGVADRCVFIQGDCEKTDLPDNCIDTVICTGVLHHMDLNFAFPEMNRIMKKGAVALAVEALDYNPVIKFYRLMTPTMRTEWEKSHILSMKDVRFAKKYFDVQEMKFWHLTSIAATFLRKKPELMTHSLKVFNMIDKNVLKLPLLQLLSWQFSFEMHKR